jgi:membrane peptidoglycan carboxypeptidase
VLRTDWTSLASSKTSAVGRLALFSAIGGVLIAAMIVPIVASTGILVRNAADKFTTLKLTGTGDLPARSEILNRDGQLLTYVYGVDEGQGMSYSGIDRAPVAYNQIAPAMLKAIVAIEDNTYWQQGAIDVKGTIRALVNDLKHEPVQGGSTIAQQYVKNVLILSAANPQEAEAATALTLNRKLNQLRMAVDVEHNMTKQQILAGYLNDAYFGNGAYGIEAAAETYFGTTAANLTLEQAATLAGIVENPTAYDPINNPALSLERRNTVLARMYQTNNGLTKAQAATAEKQPLATHPGEAQNGCTASTVGDAGFFCDYVEHVLMQDSELGTTTQARAKVLATGGLTITTTLDPSDEQSSTNAVNYVLPEYSNVYNPGRNADTQVLIQPGTGQVLSIAENRSYGTADGDTEVDYAVGNQYGGADGVQTGSSSKLFTLVTALEQGIPFGYTSTVKSPSTFTGYTTCAGGPAGQYNGIDGAFNVVNSEGTGTGTYSLYTGTADSINVFFGQLEQKVGLCNVVKTAANLGMTWANGVSLLNADPSLGFADSADNYPGFTLGELNVTPLQMAAAYATMAAQGRYCSPIVLTGIKAETGASVGVPSAGCRQAVSQDVANAVNYILQGTITSGTAAGYSLPDGRESAGKTGTSNVASGNGTPYAAFAGYTPNLASYTSVFNPISPTVNDTMAGETACYDSTMPGEEGQECPAEMYGANAPASTWYYTFTHVNLGSFQYFTAVPASSNLWSEGNGVSVKQPATQKSTAPTTTTGGGGNGNGKGNGGGNNGNPTGR